MNPIEKVGLAIAGAFPHLVLAAFALLLLWWVYLAVQLRRMKGSTLEFGAVFRHPTWPLQVRYPPWWEVRVAGDTVVFDSHEKDGVLRLTCRAAATCEDDPRDLIRGTLDAMQVALDEPNVRSIDVNPYPGGHASGFADNHDVEPPPPDAPPGYSTEERCFAAAWAFRGPHTVALFHYQCSVLFGLVDGYYHDMMMPTLLLDDHVPPRPDAARARDAADAPSLASV